MLKPAAVHFDLYASNCNMLPLSIHPTPSRFDMNMETCKMFQFRCFKAAVQSKKCRKAT